MDGIQAPKRIKELAALSWRFRELQGREVGLLELDRGVPRSSICRTTLASPLKYAVDDSGKSQLGVLDGKARFLDRSTPSSWRFIFRAVEVPPAPRSSKAMSD